SAAQAFAAMVQHFPDTPYAKEAQKKLKKLKQPVENEEDPLKLVLAENGYGEGSGQADSVIVRQRQDMADASGSSAAYGADDMPILDRPAVPDQKVRHICASSESAAQSPVML